MRKNVTYNISDVTISKLAEVSAALDESLNQTITKAVNIIYRLYQTGDIALIIRFGRSDD